MKKPQILIVDDEHANRFLLEGLLSAHNYNPVCVSDGDECLEFLKTNAPDLILLDIMMPKITGIEVLKKIMSQDSFKNIPVIMVSAKTGTSDIKEALELGAIDYIRKPFDEIELLARIKVGLRLKQNEDNLRDLVTQRDAFVGIISHDLRSPFASIYGLAEILIEDKNLTDDQRESLGYILDSVEFTLDYFNKLLSWTKLEHQEIQLEMKNAAIANLFNNVIKVMVKKAEQKNITIINSVDKGINLNVDQTFFRQVIANLIGNALKFTPNGGSIKCYSEIKDNKVLLIISDSGVGMPDELTNEKLFENSIFKSTRGTNGEKGTGLGLGICKKLLDAHKFDLKFRRNPETGTSFIISAE